MANRTENLKAIPGVVSLHESERIAEWQRLRYGMFIHWGLYSEIGGVWNGEPVTKGYNEQIQMWANISEEDYLEVANKFTAEQFDAAEICKLARDAGMKYIVITTKHHDGFSMFNTATTDYNIVEKTPYGKDPLQLLAEECRNHGLKFGIYFSLVDWHQGHEFDGNNCNSIPESMEPIIEGQLRELLTNYGPIAEVWFDMSAPTLEQSQKFASLVHELQPEAMINSRIWNNGGDFRTLGDNEIPSVPLDGAWQTPASIYHSTWGYRSWQKREDLEGKTKELVQSLVSILARGGNYLLNIGPRGDGSIVEFEAEVLRGIGSWIQRHPAFAEELAATYFDQHDWGEVLADQGSLYLCVTNWPEDGKLILSGLANNVTEVVEDGSSAPLTYNAKGTELIIDLPELAADEVLPVFRVSFEGELHVIPKNTVSETDGVWKVQPDNLYTGSGYADEGHYFTMKKTQVRLTSYLAVKEAGYVFVQLEVEADPNRKYKVVVGETEHVVSGAELSVSPIGPFTVHADEIIPMTITLAEPAHVGDDLRIDFSSAAVIRK
ncbi:alpha-L-fucosidase [Paenibacillus sp. GCM10028914]|uniref:alpha-L-fucosidase n=1 Tax=Paenibacillus sp. GCM10028914 TaxID=3273416 RepID=UPI0036170A43